MRSATSSSLLPLAAAFCLAALVGCRSDDRQAYSGSGDTSVTGEARRPAGRVPAPAATGPAATTRPAIRYGFPSLDEALSVVPAGVLPGRVRDWTDAKVDVANAALSEHVVGRWLTARVRVESVDRAEDGGYVVQAAAAEPSDAFVARLRVAFERAAAVDLARLDAGGEATVTGRVVAMDFDIDSKVTVESGGKTSVLANGVTLSVQMGDGSVVP